MNAQNLEAAAREAVSTGQSQVKNYANEAKSQADGFSSRLQDTAKDMRDRTYDAVNQMPDAFNNAVQQSRDLYSRSSDEVGRRVNKQPIESLLVAMAVGYFMGWLFTRRA